MNVKFYVYSLIDPRSGRPFYIGKGKGKRSQHHLRDSIKGKHSNPYLQNKINKIRKNGLAYGVEFLFSSYVEDECFKKEIFYISLFGRKTLCNLTDGGEGSSGVIWSDESRAKQRAIAKTRPPISEETRAKLQARTGEASSFFGKRHTEEARAKNSAAHKGKPSRNKGTHHSEEVRVKMRNPRSKEFCEKMKILANNRSLETNAKISASKKGRPSPNKGRRLSEEARANMSAAAKGKIISQEQRNKIGESLKGEKNHFFGKHHTEETLEKLRAAAKNRSPEHRAKISAAAKLRAAIKRTADLEQIAA